MRHLALALACCGGLLLSSCATLNPTTPAPGSFHVTARPSARDPDCKATGGGYINSVNVPGATISFGFTASQQTGGSPKGHVTIIDHGTGQQYLSADVGLIQCTDTGFLIAGQLTNGQGYVIIGDDNRALGSPDAISIFIFQDDVIVRTEFGSLQGGNLTVH